MARRRRSSILYDGCYAHVYSRAIEKRFVLDGEADFEYFKRLLAASKAAYNYRIHHYCVMNTHFHILVSMTDHELFSRGMKALKHQYALYVQKQRKKGGPVWWGRFGSQQIEDERYLLACGLYIEMNPVSAGMVSMPEEWPHSSSRHYYLGAKDPLVDPYEQPSRDTAIRLMPGLNVCRGASIGSELYQIYRKDSFSAW